MAAIGIDFGTTHARVAVWSKGNISRSRVHHGLSSKDVNIVVNELGFRSTPSYVSYHDEEIIVGDTAYNKFHTNSSNTIFHSRKFLGKPHSHDIKYPFQIQKGEKNTSIFTVQHQGNEKQLLPEDVCSLVLKNLKEMAEGFCGSEVSDAVIAVPFHFTQQERKSLLSAAELAGLHVLRLISEPAATAISYSLDENVSRNEIVVVFDLGGASLDVSVMNIDQGIMKVLASKTDSSLGGELFTDALVDFCIQQFKKKTNVDITGNVKATHRLKTACELAKKAISQQNQDSINVDSLADGLDFCLKISRSRFEDIIYNQLRSCTKLLEVALDEANIAKEDVDKILLVGGSSKIPKVQEMVAKFFGKDDIEVSANPDEAVAVGATMQAILLSNSKELEFPEIQTVDVTPLSLGIAAADGSMVFMIERETVLPTTHTERFSTSVDNQSALLLEIYEGERLIAKENTLLGQVALEGIPSLPAEEPQIDVTFSVDKNGVLSINAVEISSTKSVQLTIHNDNERLTREDVDRLVQEAQDKADEDQDLLDSLQNVLNFEEDSVKVNTVATVEGFDDDMD